MSAIVDQVVEGTGFYHSYIILFEFCGTQAFQIRTEKAADWWLKLDEKERIKRKTCIRIHVLSPFLFGVVPPGHGDKVGCVHHLFIFKVMIFILYSGYNTW